MTKTCFVVMGFNEKTDPNSGRVLDLDRTYRGIIKPAAKAAGYKVFRADEIQHSGIIDIPMYKSLLQADLVIADLSTLNANAFFELGVRYALRRKKTIVIAENGFKNPFDTNHISMRFYQHDGKVLDFEVVDQFKQELIELINDVDKADEDDSPVYAFLEDFTNPLAETQQPQADRNPAKGQLSGEDGKNVEAASETPYAALMEKVGEFRAAGQFEEMASVLSGISVAQGDDVEPFVLHQLALATYKSEKPNKEASFLKAQEILQPLNPTHALDAETIGLWGAIHKRLYELQNGDQETDNSNLNTAINAYNRGFQLLHDYYNGINAAFLYDVRAHLSNSDEAAADHVIAQRIRKSVLHITEDLLHGPISGASPEDRIANKYWIEATKVEALLGLGRKDEALNLFEELKTRDGIEDWMIASTSDQLGKLKNLLETKA